jgi:hypothetical protein
LEFGDDGGGAAFKADEVVLFSGGLDSYRGTLDQWKAYCAGESPLLTKDF